MVTVGHSLFSSGQTVRVYFISQTILDGVLESWSSDVLVLVKRDGVKAVIPWTAVERIEEVKMR